MLPAMTRALQEMAEVTILALRLWQVAADDDRSGQFNLGTLLRGSRQCLQPSPCPDENDPRWIQCLEIASIVVNDLGEYERN